jgi:predicted Abi (CAAX) family protease
MYSWKNLQMVVTVVLLSLAAACSLFSLDVAVPQTFEMRIDHPADAAPHFYVLKDVDTNTKEVQKHAGNVQSFTIRGITYKVKDFKGDDNQVVSGDIEFAPSGSSDFTLLGAFSNLSLKEGAESAQEDRMVLSDAAAKEKLTKLMQAGKLITFRLNAHTNQNPIAATLVVNIDTKMTVEL